MAKKLYIVGICGTFTAGIATLAKQLGYNVSGCDQQVYPPMSDYLAEQGIQVDEGFDPQYIIQAEADDIIIANAISRGNKIVEYVLDQRLNYYSAPSWLAKHVLRGREVIAVSGTHGKTTTSSLLTWILHSAGLKPGYLIAGKVNHLPCTASLGDSSYFVIEADEYDSAFDDKRPKFMHYHPKRLIIHNLEFDHADIYADLAAIKKQFQWLLRTVPSNGQLYVAVDDINVQEVVGQHAWSPVCSYGIEQGDWQAQLITADGQQFSLWQEGAKKIAINWSLIGEHNVKNALAASVVAMSIGVDAVDIQKALASFAGVERRMAHYATVAEIDIYDDFAHHPTAINHALLALRKKIGNTKRIIAVIEMASSTMRCGVHDQVIINAVEPADYVVLLCTDPSSELTQLVSMHKKSMCIYQEASAALNELQRVLQANDQVLFMSNRSTLQLPKRLQDFLLR